MNKEQIQAAAKAAYEQYVFLAKWYPDTPWDKVGRSEQAAWIAVSCRNCLRRYYLQTNCNVILVEVLDTDEIHNRLS